MALTKVNNDLQDALAAAQPTITSTGTLTGFTSTGIDDNATSNAITIDAAGAATFNAGVNIGGNSIFNAPNIDIKADDARLLIEEADGTNMVWLGDLTGAGVGGCFLYNHGGTAVVQLRSDSASTIGHGLTVDGTTNTTLSIEGDTSAGSTFINFADGTATTKAQISGAKAGASGGRLTFSTNNSSGTSTEAMRIDQVGRVTQPYQPSFRVGATASFSGNGTIHLHPTSYHDVGNNYAPSNGRFTAPVAGVYYFGVQLISLYNSTTNEQNFILTKNGAPLCDARCLGHSSSSSHLKTVVQLAVGDYICVQNGNGNTATYANAFHNQFCGYLIG